jgi:transposase InsO family protein
MGQSSAFKTCAGRGKAGSGEEIQAAHRRTRETCGAERLQRDLAEHGVEVKVCRIKRIRKNLGLKCKQKKKFKATTDSNHTLPVAENLLEQEFEASAPNEVWNAVRRIADKRKKYS